MNKFFAYLLLIIPFAATAQYDTIFHTQKINLLTVSIDYEDYSFSGASMNYYDCPDCTNDSLPYLVDFEQPMDFGSMTFQLNPLNDTIFHGGIVWMGTGQMTHPLLSSNTNAPFDNVGNPLPVPPQISYLGVEANPIPANNETALAWEAVSQLRIVQMIAGNDYDVLCYLYAPTVGTYDPGPAKWIFFFYKKNYIPGPVGIDESELLNVRIYPNPATEKLYFSSPLSLQSYSISDFSGKIVESGKIASNELAIDHFPDGMYFIQFETTEGNKQKQKFVKQ